MNKVLIVSDSHGLKDELVAIKQRHQLKYMIHCGDSELDIDAPEMEGFIKVAGNCDWDARYPNSESIEINGLSFFVTHGHLYHVKSGLMSLSYEADSVGAAVICFGHTHIAGAEKNGNQLFMNPGSISSPRNRVEKTYAVMEWDSLDNINVIFYSVDGVKVPELSYHVSLN